MWYRASKVTALGVSGRCFHRLPRLRGTEVAKGMCLLQFKIAAMFLEKDRGRKGRAVFCLQIISDTWQGAGILVHSGCCKKKKMPQLGAL